MIPRGSLVELFTAFYGGVPDAIESAVKERLPAEFLDVIDAFDARYPPRR